MATIKQRKAVDKLVENGGRSVSSVMREVGYTAATAVTPSKLTESKGFHELMEEKGLTDTLLLNALVDDIKAAPGDRDRKLELGFKLRGRLKDTVDQSTNINVLHIYIPEERKN